MSRRMLQISKDPEASKVLLEHKMPDPEAFKTNKLHERIVRSMLESMAARGLVPSEWTHDDRVELFLADPASMCVALQNPRALLDAERLLLDALSTAGGSYIGIRYFDDVPYGKRPFSSYVPDDQDVAACCHARTYVGWTNSMRTSGPSDWPRMADPLVSQMADQILDGPEWVESLYDTGFGMLLWDWKETASRKNPKWVLLARPGDGLPWPWMDTRAK